MHRYVDEDGIKRGLLRSLARRFFLRFHVLVILVWTFCWALAMSHLLLVVGQSSMAMRYGVALVFAYLMFLLAVRLWLQYTGYGRHLRDEPDLPSDIPGAQFPSGGPRAVEFEAGGGDFGGAGASASFDAGGVAEGGAGVAGDSLGAAAAAAEGGLPGLVIAILILVATVLTVVAAYLVSSAPLFLVDAAFEALLAGGLVRGARRMDTADWVGAVVRATIIPFLVIIVLSVVAAGIMQSYLPEVETLSDAFNSLRSR